MNGWQEYASKLPCGSRRRIKHCKADNSMIVSHDPKGISSYCFRCGEHSFLPHGIQSIEAIRKREAEYRNRIQNGSISLPDDYTLDIPMHNMTWFLQYGITAELARAYSIGYSPGLDRVVLPVFEKGELVAVQNRATDIHVKPKYLNPWGRHVSDAVFWSDEYHESPVIVVVEDILSAIKGGQVLPFASVLGTKISDARINKIVARASHVFLWFDGDEAGQDARVRYTKELKFQGVHVWNIVTPLDPKKYTVTEIRKIIGEAKQC